MKIQFANYKIAFATSLNTAHQSYNNREGIIYKLSSAEFEGIGELAPLPNYSHETLEEAKENIETAFKILFSNKNFEREIPKNFSGLRDFMSDLEKKCILLPSVRWALETMIADFCAKRASLSLASWLNHNPRSAVPINAILPSNLIDNFDEKFITTKLKNGFKVFKIKVVAERIEEQIKMIKKVDALLPSDCLIRLDFNQGLDKHDSLEVLTEIKDCKIEYVEEPVKEFNSEAINLLREASGIKVALDETLDNPEYREAALGDVCYDVLILKPMMLGGFINTFELARTCENLGVGIALTSTFESSIGISAVLHAAAALHVEPLTCGLDTASLFCEDLIKKPIQIVDGKMLVPTDSGLGVELVDLDFNTLIGE